MVVCAIIIHFEQLLPLALSQKELGLVESMQAHFKVIVIIILHCCCHNLPEKCYNAEIDRHPPMV